MAVASGRKSQLPFETVGFVAGRHFAKIPVTLWIRKLIP